MSSNMKLVRYFVDGFLNNSKTELSNLVSPNFVYCLNNGDDINFEQFIMRMRFVNSLTKFVTQEVTSEDDVHFYFDFESFLPAPNDEEKIDGFAQVIVQNGLIVRVDIHYKVSAEEFKEFQERMTNNSTVLL